MPARVPTQDVIAFRLAAHQLGERTSAPQVGDVAGRCGSQDSPVGSALLALHARVAGITRAGIDAAIAEDQSLLTTWAMRGAPFVLPADDAAVFTTGVLPPTEEARLQLIRGVGPALDALGMGLDEAVAATRAEIGSVLAGRRLAIGPLGQEIAPRVAATLTKGRRLQWEAEGPYAKGQPLGEAVVHFCIRMLTLEQVVCFAPREGNAAPFVLVEEWLHRPIPPMDAVRARAELVRRYLRCYGPSTRAHLAAWLGVRAGDAHDWWDLVRDELTEVDHDGRAWLLTEDVDALGRVAMPEGVRMLPPGDAYTQLRDRDTIVDRAHHRAVWKTVGAPGTVLVDGQIIGTWRPRKSGRTLTITVTPFAPLPSHAETRIRAEAETIGPLRGAATVVVDVDPG